MTAAELERLLQGAFLPFAKGFLSEPEDATLALQISAGKVIATLWMSAADFAHVDGDGDCRSLMSRAFNGLVRHVDGVRIPTITYGEDA
ncbi:MAG: hypothetical protein KC731_23590 [Myxococcales bacterium]|nr:hypothetical protein [Myxococcales bacterium]